MDEKYEKVKKILEKYNQKQLLIWYDKLIEQKKEELLDQILATDFEQVEELYKSTKEKKNFKDCKIEPLHYIDKQKLQPDEREEYEKKGIEVIKNGKYAVVTMAGGQGTRLGHNGPKGTFELDIGGEKKPLFTLLSQTIKEAREKYNAVIPWYIMTSRENNYKTTQFFKRHEYFGMGEENIIFFMQNELPMVNERGKILVDEEGMLKQAADGHGGIFEALRKNGIIEDMKKRGMCLQKWLIQY